MEIVLVPLSGPDLITSVPKSEEEAKVWVREMVVCVGFDTFCYVLGA